VYTCICMYICTLRSNLDVGIRHSHSSTIGNFYTYACKCMYISYANMHTHTRTCAYLYVFGCGINPQSNIFTFVGTCTRAHACHRSAYMYICIYIIYTCIYIYIYVYIYICMYVYIHIYIYI